MNLLNIFYKSPKPSYKRLNKRTRASFVEFPPERDGIISKNLPNYCIFHEEDFESKILKWDRPCIDTTWFAQKTLNAIGSPIEAATREKLHTFLRAIYSPAKGFHLTKNKRTCSLHTIHCALGLVISLAAAREGNLLNWQKPRGKDFFVFEFDAIFESKGEQVFDTCLNYIKSLLFKSEGTACYSESSDYRPTATATASALWCLWQMDAFPEAELDAISNFIYRLLTEYEEGSFAIKNAFHEKEAYLCSTYYGFRTLFSIEHFRGEKTAQHVKTLEKRAGIKKYIEMATERPYGYSAMKGKAPSMIHTKDALALMQKKYELNFDFTNEYYEQVYHRATEMINISSQSQCYPCSGFASTEYFYPNVYGTLLALDMFKYLNTIAVENNIEQQPTPEVHKKGIQQFISSCFNSTTGAYRGYSYAEEYLPNMFIDRTTAATDSKLYGD